MPLKLCTQLSLATLFATVGARSYGSGSYGSYPGQADVDMTLMHTRIGTPFNARAIAGLFRVESKVSDELTVGARLATSGSLIRSAFARFDFGNGFTANLNSEGTSAVKGDLTWDDDLHFRGHRARSMKKTTLNQISHRDKQSKVIMHLDSASSAAVERVSFYHTNQGWTMNPSVNLRTRRIDLVASTDCSPTTHLKVAVKGDGSSLVEVDHALDEATSVKVKGKGVGVKGLSLEVTHHVDKHNCVRPCYDVDSKSFLLSWIHKLDGYNFGGFGGSGSRPQQYSTYDRRRNLPSSSGAFYDGRDGQGGSERVTPQEFAARDAHYHHGRRMTVNVVPYHYASVELESDDSEDWSASLSMPWGDAKSTTLSFSRKYPM